MTEEIKVKDITIKDFWILEQVKIFQEKCSECGKIEGDIIIQKGKDLSNLIKVLQKLNYKGIPKDKLKRRGNK